MVLVFGFGYLVGMTSKLGHHIDGLWCVNNLPRVVTWWWSGSSRTPNLRIIGFDTLTTTLSNKVVLVTFVSGQNTVFKCLAFAGSHWSSLCNVYISCMAYYHIHITLCNCAVVGWLLRGCSVTSVTCLTSTRPRTVHNKRCHQTVRRLPTTAAHVTSSDPTVILAKVSSTTSFASLLHFFFSLVSKWHINLHSTQR